MNNLINCYRLTNKKFPVIFKTAQYFSTQTLPEEVQEPKKSDIFTRVIKHKPQRKPFMKNVFLGEFDCEVLGFPEAINNEELRKLEDRATAIRNYISKIQSESTVIPVNVLENLSALKIFSLQSPETYEGLELTESENCKILEAIATSNSLAASLIVHQYFGVQAIIKAGSEYLQKKYLLDLSSGKKIASFCLLEKDNLDPSYMKVAATRQEDGSFILNGTKAWVINGSQSNIYLVLAVTEKDPKLPDKMSVLVVEEDFGGITVKPCSPTGLKGSDICTITFNNTPVPQENVIGKGGDSMKIISTLLPGYRLSTGPACIGVMHKLIDAFSKSVIRTKSGAQYISDSDFIHEKISQMNLDLYAMESMTYMTAGLLDRYEKHDCELESAIVKVYCSEKCLDAVQECIKLSGPPAFMEDHWLNKLYNDALGHCIMSETNGSLRMVVALLGLQHAGLGLNSSVKKFRNPFFFPGFIIKKIWEKRRQEADNPKLNLHLENYVHPSLTHAARWLEYCVYRLQHATETLLIRHGPEIVNQHMELRRLSDVAMNVYAMSSVISRASRSYCIGLRNADHEIILANAFCLNSKEIVKHLVIELTNGPYGTNDINYQRIATRALECNGYFPEHPLTKNF